MLQLHWQRQSSQPLPSLLRRALELSADLATFVLRVHHVVLVLLTYLSTACAWLIDTAEYGECGVGAYCLGGCDPLFSTQLDSCVPEPVCQSNNYQLTSLDGITPNTKYLGDSSKADWVSSGTPLQAPTNDAVILTLSEDGQSSSGTLLASTTYVWYGNVTAVMKSSRGQGVVSAFILLSDNKDEIDFEFVGADLNSVQSNFYFQGITDCMFTVKILSRSY